MPKTFIVAVAVGNAIAAVLATWPPGILNAIAAGFLAGFALGEGGSDHPA